MATKGGGGSLLGKADTTLVQGSYREAMANKPANLSGLYERRAEKFDDFLGMVGEAFDMQTKKEKENDKITEANKELALDNYSAGKVNEYYERVAYDAVEATSEKIKNFPGDKNSLEYKKLNRKMTRLAEISKINIEEFQTLLSTQISTIGAGKELDLANQIFKDLNDNSNESDVKWDEEKEDFVYTLKEDTAIGSPVLGGERDPDFDIEVKPKFSMTMSELRKSLNSVNPAATKGYYNLLIDQQKNVNKVEWNDSTRNDLASNIEKLIRDKNTKHNIMTENMPGKDYSFYDALGGKDVELQEEIFDALIAVDFDFDTEKEGVQRLGKDEDGEVTAYYKIDGNWGKDEDYHSVTMENFEGIKNAITNSPQGDEIIAKTLADRAGKYHYDIGEESREEDPNKGLTAGQQQTNRQKNEAYSNALKAFTDSSNRFNNDPDRNLKVGTTIPGWDGKTAKLEKDSDGKFRWYIYGKDGKVTEATFPHPPGDVAPNMGLINFLSGKTKSFG